MSAPIFGVDSGDPQTEQRLRLIELELSKRATAVSKNALRLVRTRSQPPIVTGLELQNAIGGGISISWDETAQKDLRRYEIDIDSSPAFNANPRTFKTTNNYFIFPRAESETFQYVRVRQENTAFLKSDFTATLNIVTGALTYDDLESGAVSRINSFVKTGGFEPRRLIGDNTATTQQADWFQFNLNVPTPSEFSLYGKIDIDFRYQNTGFFAFELWVDGNFKDLYRFDLSTDHGAGSPPYCKGRIVYPLITMPILLGEGDHLVVIRSAIKVLPAHSFIGTNERINPNSFEVFVWEARN